MVHFRVFAFITTLTLFCSLTPSHASLSFLEIEGVDASQKAFAIKIKNIADFAHFDLSSTPDLTADKTIKELRLGALTDEPNEALVNFRLTNQEALKSLNWVHLQGLTAESPAVVTLFEQLDTEHFRYDFSSSHDGVSINFSPLDMSFSLVNEDYE